MKIAMVGTGYVGLVSGACFSEMGIDVVCVDIDSQKIENLKKGVMPIYEPGLESLVTKNYKEKRLIFTDSLESYIDSVDVIFSAVGTPPDNDGSADLSFVMDVARTVGRFMNSYKVIVTKSTVPIGTAKKVKKVILEELEKRGLSIEFDVVSNPEFLKEGVAINDSMYPERVVIGVESEKAKEIMEYLYKPFVLNGSPLMFMDIASAEMTKYAANAMLATRISFMNEIANLCEIVGADISKVRKGIASDSRIGSKFLYAGIGYGGSCFPKDVKALCKIGRERGYTMELVEAVEKVNELQKELIFYKLKAMLGNLSGKKIALWGLAFKPETDDMREAPSLVVIDLLVKSGAIVVAFDPISTIETKRKIGDIISYSDDMYNMLKDADALMLLTEWKQFRLPSWDKVKVLMRGNLILDGRNIYDRKELEALGFVYGGIGR